METAPSVQPAGAAGQQPTTRRVVTGHDREGKAIVIFDEDAKNVRHRSSSGVFSTLLWVTDEAPADNSRAGDAADQSIGTAPPPNGSVFRIVDFPPASLMPEAADNAAVLAEMGIRSASGSADRSPFMHRTKSVDYAIILTGQIVMLLDDTEVALSAGDVLVQRGTNHAWINRSDGWCRVAFVLIDAKPVEAVED